MFFPPAFILGRILMWDQLLTGLGLNLVGSFGCYGHKPLVP